MFRSGSFAAPRFSKTDPQDLEDIIFGMHANWLKKGYQLAAGYPHVNAGDVLGRITATGKARRMTRATIGVGSTGTSLVFTEEPPFIPGEIIRVSNLKAATITLALTWAAGDTLLVDLNGYTLLVTAVGATVTLVAAEVAAAINADPYMGGIVVATSALGVVTLTEKYPFSQPISLAVTATTAGDGTGTASAAALAGSTGTGTISTVTNSTKIIVPAATVGFSPTAGASVRLVTDDGSYTPVGFAARWVQGDDYDPNSPNANYLLPIDYEMDTILANLALKKNLLRGLDALVISQLRMRDLNPGWNAVVF